MKIREALAEAAGRLEGVSDTPRLDAELLMAHALGVEREAMLLSRLDDPVPPAFGPLLARREAREPVAYIVGRRAFWTIELEVGPGALVPRPESETLLDAALSHFGRGPPATILDLGTGPGTLLLAALAEWPAARGLGVDASDEALAYARRNAVRLGMEGRADFRLGDWGEGLDGRFDLILCNPPYVEVTAQLMRDISDWEPHLALFGGEDGLAAYRLLAPQIGRLLGPGGIACIELGAGQEAGVAPLFEAEGLETALHPDLAGHARCLTARH